MLSQYLKQLMADGVISKRINKDRIEYELTQRGKAAELMRTRALASGFQAAKAILANEQAADLFADMAKMARNNPEMFQAIMDWAFDLSLFLTSDPMLESRWYRVLGGDQEEWRPFKEEIQKRLPKSTDEIKTPAQLRTLLYGILDATKQLVADEKMRRHKS